MKKVSLKDYSILSINIFVTLWLFGGIYWSLFSRFFPGNIGKPAIILCSFIYVGVMGFVITMTIKEIYKLNHYIKWILFLIVLIFGLFVIPPPRNADAMRVWLSKVYDVWMHKKLIFRPYFFSFTPDAFTLFHLPLIDIFDGQIFQLSIFTGFCSIITLLLRISKCYIKDDFYILVVLLIFSFNPLVILASTTVVSDIPIILAIAGLVYYVIKYGESKNELLLLIIFTYFAFGMNVKYNMLMIAPFMFIWLTYGEGYKAFKQLNFFAWIVILLIIVSALYPYVLNYLLIKNPVFPALVKLFPSGNALFDKMGYENAEASMCDPRTMKSFFTPFFTLFIIPKSINPLSMLPILFICRKFKKVKYLPCFLAFSYIFILWIMMPSYATAYRERYIMYIFPSIIPFGIYGILQFLEKYDKRKILKTIFNVSFIIISVVYSYFLVIYSRDLLNYITSWNKKNWHHATWYYQDYKWINKNIDLKKDEKILVYISGQQTYYLRKSYINADSWSSAINWDSILTSSDFLALLKKRKFKFFFIDESIVSSDYKLSNIIIDLMKNGNLKVIRENNVKLCISRIKRKYIKHKTKLYEIVI